MTMTSKTAVMWWALTLATACGGDDASGFLVRARVRGMPISAITMLQIRFEASGDTFGSASGSKDGVQYATEDDGTVFVATGDETWVNSSYELASNEFLFEMPFENPSDGAAEVNIRALVLREIGDDTVQVGDSARVPAHLPADADAEIEVVVGCIDEDLCRAEVEE